LPRQLLPRQLLTTRKCCADDVRKRHMRPELLHKSIIMVAHHDMHRRNVS
jgi:hypothetical protein